MDVCKTVPSFANELGIAVMIGPNCADFAIKSVLNLGASDLERLRRSLVSTDLIFELKIFVPEAVPGLKSPKFGFSVQVSAGAVVEEPPVDMVSNVLVAGVA